MYSISVLIRAKGFQEILCGQTAGMFHVRHPLFDTHFGVFHETAQWRLAGAKLARLANDRGCIRAAD
jgi:hypothetical protein